MIGIATIGSFSQADQFLVNVERSETSLNFPVVALDYELRFFAPLRMTDYDGSACRRLSSLHSF
jgi:hypothetical protein